MKLHIITVGQPKLPYAKLGWDEYLNRLKRYHNVRVSAIADKQAYEPAAFLRHMGHAYKVALVIDSNRSFSSPALAIFLEERAQEGREICFVIGGPEGLPQEVINACDCQWSISPLTFPHDLAMVIVAEALYRASTIAAGHPYHKS